MISNGRRIAPVGQAVSIVAGFRRGDGGPSVFPSRRSGGTDPNAQFAPVAAERADQRDRLSHVLPLNLAHIFIVTPNRKSPGSLLNSFVMSVYYLSDLLSLTFV